jgi:hypothetical protein
MADNAVRVKDKCMWQRSQRHSLQPSARWGVYPIIQALIVVYGFADFRDGWLAEFVLSVAFEDFSSRQNGREARGKMVVGVILIGSSSCDQRRGDGRRCREALLVHPHGSATAAVLNLRNRPVREEAARVQFFAVSFEASLLPCQ